MHTCLIRAQPVVIDAEELKDGKWTRVPLHYNIEPDPSKLPRWRCSRGTNKCENYFRHFHGILPGPNNSVEKADRIFDIHNLR